MSEQSAIIIPFRAATSADRKLHPIVEAAIRDKNFKPPAPVRDILTWLSSYEPKIRQELYDTALHFIDTALLMQEHADEYFHFRKEKIYPSMYYFTLAGPVLDLDKTHTITLPPDYEALSNQYDKFAQDHNNLLNPDADLNAYFCFCIERYKLLEDFLLSLQNGTLSLDDPNLSRYYAQIVTPAYAVVTYDTALEEKIVKKINDINFIINHADHELCAFIRATTDKKLESPSFSPHSILQSLPSVTTLRTTDIVNTSYALFCEINNDDEMATLYDYHQRVIAPIQLLHLVSPTASPQCIDYMIAHACINASPNPDKTGFQFGIDVYSLYKNGQSQLLNEYALAECGIREEEFHDIISSFEICDLYFQSLHVGGDKVVKTIDDDAITALYAKLQSSTNHSVDNPHLRSIWKNARSTAINHINEFLEKFPEAQDELGISPSIV